MKKPHQDFARYATPWEKLYSTLCGSGVAEPVVDESLAVVGHVGWFSPEFIFVQMGVGAFDRNGDGYTSINEILERHGTVHVAMTRPTGNNRIAIINPDPATEVAYNQGLPGGHSTSFRLLADKHGVVKLQLGTRGNDGLAPPAIDPFVLLGIGRMVFSVGRG